MTFADWFPSLSTASLIAGALWLCRNLIATRLTKGVEFEFNEKLEAVRAEALDASQGAGELCERSYDALNPPP